MTECNMSNRVVRRAMFSDYRAIVLSPEAKWFLVGLMSAADDNGYVSLDRKFLKKHVLVKAGQTIEEIETWIEELTEADFLSPYTVDAGEYASIVEWNDKESGLTYQYVDISKRKKLVNPAPDQSSDKAVTTNTYTQPNSKPRSTAIKKAPRPTIKPLSRTKKPVDRDKVKDLARRLKAQKAKRANDKVRPMPSKPPTRVEKATPRPTLVKKGVDFSTAKSEPRKARLRKNPTRQLTIEDEFDKVTAKVRALTTRTAGQESPVMKTHTYDGEAVTEDLYNAMRRGDYKGILKSTALAREAMALGWL